MLTTGGGWQDQVGGLCPGIKAGSSKNELPLQIGVRHINCSEEFLKTLDKHLLVVFTGKTRLARNMLQVISLVLIVQHYLLLLFGNHRVILKVDL